MRITLPTLLGFLAASGILWGSEKEPPAPPPLGTRIAELSLPRAADGRTWSLVEDGRDAKAVVVAFLGTECPLSNLYLPVLAALHREYAPKGVAFIGVNSNPQDDAAAVARHAKEHGLPFAVVKEDGAAVDKFRAVRVPEVFVLDGTRTVRYRGRIDDQYAPGVKRPRPTSPDLRDALDAVLAGKPVARPVTEAAGCPISRPARHKPDPGCTQPAVTYTKHVARILQQNCQECHRRGEVGPF